METSCPRRADGATTAVKGNALFSWWRYGNTAYMIASLAADRPGHDYIATKSCDWSLTQKRAGIGHAQFGEYLDAIDIGLGVNMMPLVGHNPLRLGAMDKAAWDRAATEDEVRVMQDLLRGAMEDGAWGWSTTNSSGKTRCSTSASPRGMPTTATCATTRRCSSSRWC